MIKIVFALLLAGTLPSPGAGLEPGQVAVVYNANSPDGRDLALEYMRLRKIPNDNLVALFCPTTEEISRDEYTGAILEPLRKASRERQWWTFSRDPSKPVLSRKIHALVLISGMPLKIRHARETADEKPSPSRQNNASVDSELMLMAVDGVPTKGWVPNPYYGKEQEFADSGLPIVLVTRLDSASPATTRRMMNDAVHVERKGLWGWAVVDIGGPHAEGNKWLEETAALAENNGFPLLVDRWGETLPLNYPLMDDVAVYWGWYAWNVNGPFLEQGFRFKPGAVAVHIHSYSASSLKKADASWCSPLLDRGAAVTAGNVYEPYLGPSQHVNVFFDRLLKGYSLAEAAGMSLPVLSWQTVVLGDPLYRPFALRHSGNVVKSDDDKYYQAWWQAGREWAANPALRKSNMEAAAANTPAGNIFWEALGYEALRSGNPKRAKDCLRKAEQAANSDKDRIRAEMEMSNVLRTGDMDAVGAKTVLELLKSRYSGSPYVKAVDEWLKRMSAVKPAA